MIEEFCIQRKNAGWHFNKLVSPAIHLETLLPGRWGVSFNSQYQTKNKIILIVVNRVRSIDSLIAEHSSHILSPGDTPEPSASIIH